MKLVLKRIAKISAYIAAAVFVLLLLLAALTQTSFFKDHLRTILVSTISTGLNGSLTLGTIDGNFITGFTVDSIEIYQGENLFLTSSKISFSYDLLPVLRKQYDITHLIIEHPTIHFRRSRSGQWNAAGLFRSSTDSTTGVLDGIVTVGDLQLKNATVILADSTSIEDVTNPLSRTEFNYNNFTLHDVNLQLTAVIKNNDIKISIPHLSFYSITPKFELSHFKGEFIANERGIAVSDVIIQSNQSYLELDASMRGINIFHGVELYSMKGDSTRVRLKANALDFSELKTLLSQVGFLNGSAVVDLAAEGEFGNLTVHHLNIKTHQSSLNLSGAIRNLHDPHNLYLDVSATNSKIFPSDLARLMPDFNLPSFEKTGETILSIQFKGSPLNFTTWTSAKGAFGEFAISGMLNLTKSLPEYDAVFSTKRLSIGPLLNNENLNSSITSKGTIQGAGFGLDGLQGTLDLAIDTSRIRHLSFTKSTLHITANEKKFDITYSLADHAMSAAINGQVDLTLSDRTVIDGDVDLTSINLGNILNEPKYESDLTFRGSVIGSGNTISDASGTLRLYLLPSTFGGKELLEQEINLSLDQHNQENKQLTLTSKIADLDFRGKFDLDLAVEAIALQSSHLVKTIQDHASPPDSVTDVAISVIAAHSEIDSPQEMDFTYSMNVKNLGPVSVLFEGPQFDAKANLSGVIRGTRDELSFSCKGVIDHFFIGRIDSGVIFNNATVDARVNPISNQQTLEKLSGTLDFSIGSALVSGRQIDSARIALTYNNMRGNLSLRGLFESSYSIIMEGQTSVQPNTYVFDVENLTAGYGDYIWQNNQDVQFRLNHEGVRIMRAVMRRNEEELSLTGILRHEGDFDMKATLRNGDLRGVNIWIPVEYRTQEGRGFSGRANADLTLSGTTASPKISFSLQSENTYFRRSKIGKIDASIRYSDESATIDVITNDSEKDSLPDLTVKGTVAVNLGLTGVEHRFPDREQQLQIRSDGFDLSVIDPLIWELDQLSGKLTCNVDVSGTPQTPEYHGSIELNNLRFLFMPNNVAYIAEGELEPSGEKLLLKNIIVRNVPEDNVDGEARFEGSITIKDYTISTFDITMYGTLLAMTDATRKIIPTMYGRLFATPDSKGLNLSGTLSRPFLSGNLEVLDANIIFPPTRLYETANSKTSLSYLVVDDTSKKIDTPLRFPKNFYSDEATLRPSTPLRNIIIDEPTLLDRLRYNLTIETKGTTAVRMIFTPSEELYAELEGKVRAINDQGIATIYGEIAVTPRSYYNFFKQFDATGTLKFVGPWDNPELNIEATYEGYRQVSASDGSQENGQIKELKTVVLLNIEGTRYEPKLRMSMKVQREQGGDLVDWSTQARGGDEQSDALSFILTGKFKEDLTSNEQTDIATSVGTSTTTSVAYSVTSNLLTQVLDNFMRKQFPFIRRVDVSYREGTPTVIIDTSPWIGRLRYGTSFNSLNNANVSYQVSLGDLFRSPTIRNLFIEIQRKVESSLTETNRGDVTNEARLYYRFSF